MSRQFLTPINLSQNALQNAVAHPLAGPPASPVNGQLYWDTVLLQFLIWNGTSWGNLASNSLLLGGQNGAYYNARANATGTQLASTISNFAAAANALTLDTFAAPVAALNVNSQRITSVGNPTSATDAANKNYVDITVQGLTAKPSARAATAAALPTNVYANGAAGVGATLTATANGVLIVDTYAPALNDVLLIKNEATLANNGEYTLTQVGTASVPYILTRHVDMDQATEFGGAFIPVENFGSANANSLWICNVANTITVGTTAVVFTQTNGATDLINGNGITISGNTVSFLPDPAANKGLTVTGSGAAINFGGTYSWTGANSFTAALNASLGLTVSGGAFTSRGIADNATATALTLTAGAQIGSPTGGDKGAGTLNATGVFVNGVAVGTSVGANPTAVVGLAAVNGVATSYMRSDAAPALSVAITPTWTGPHTFSGGVTITAPSSGTALSVTGLAGNATANLQASTAAGNSYGLSVSGGTSATDWGLSVNNATGTNLLTLFGNGGAILGAPIGGNKGAGTLNLATGVYINGVLVNANNPQKYSTAIGDGATLTYTVTHNLGTQDVVASVYSATTPFAEVDCDINHATANTATFTFASAPSAGQFRVVLHG